jgi:hypothetical protein
MYFQRSKGFLSKSPKDAFGNSFLDLVFMCINKLETVGLSGHDDVEFVVLLKILVVLVENCFQEIVGCTELYETIFQLLMKYLSIKDRGTLIQINSLQLMCVLLYLNPKMFVDVSRKFNVCDQIFYSFFGQIDLFEQFNQKDDLLLGITGIFGLQESSFPDVIPTSSLIREAYNCVKSIFKSKSQLLCNSEGDSQETRHCTEAQEEEDLFSEDDEDDDDWNEDVYFQEELNYEYESPFQDVDPVEQFQSVLGLIETRNPLYFKSIISQLAPAERNELNGLFMNMKQMKCLNKG